MIALPSTNKVIDPFAFKNLLWPKVRFYKEQIEIIESVRDNDETFVCAGNMLGKDFVAAFIVLWFFCSRYPCRIVLTSMAEEHLSVLWDEIREFINTAKYALDSREGGNLEVLTREIYLLKEGMRDAKSSIKAIVAGEDAARNNVQKSQKFSGRHIALTGDRIPRTLLVGDEASAISDLRYSMGQKWAHRMLFIGNPWPCNNFFKKAFRGDPETGKQGGDIPKADGTFYRKCIHISAKDSPSVKRAFRQIAEGKTPDNKLVIPGVIPYDRYVKQIQLLSPNEKAISVDGEWYEGADVMLYPTEWLNLSMKYADTLINLPRIGRAMGVDSAFGGDNTCWCIVGDYGLLELFSTKTPNTAFITSKTIQLMREYNLPPEKVFFDAGGGGKPHVDRLRQMGYNISMVWFGENIKAPLARTAQLFNEKKEMDETRYSYKNRRAQMYGILRLLLEPRIGEDGKQSSKFALPRLILNRPRPDGKASLKEQLKCMPYLLDAEGRLRMLPKSDPDPDDPNKETLTRLIGCSPDEADALVLATYGRQFKGIQRAAGIRGAM